MSDTERACYCCSFGSLCGVHKRMLDAVSWPGFRSRHGSYTTIFAAVADACDRFTPYPEAEYKGEEDDGSGEDLTTFGDATNLEDVHEVEGEGEPFINVMLPPDDEGEAP